MAFKLRMPITDILHRGVLYSLVGLSVWGIVMMGAVHRDTLQRGKEALAQQERAVAAQQTKVSEEESNEIALAEAAQRAFRGSSKQS